mgnify:CR=1 FL=1
MLEHVTHAHDTEAFLLWVYREEIALSGIDPKIPQSLDAVRSSVNAHDLEAVLLGSEQEGPIAIANVEPACSLSEEREQREHSIEKLPLEEPPLLGLLQREPLVLERSLREQGGLLMIEVSGRVNVSAVLERSPC